MDEFKTIKRVSATTQVIETIKDSINSGKLKPGDKLPNEIDLARTLGVGRSSLREGIRTLSSFGLVEIKHGEGTFVADKYAERIFEFLGYDATPENISHILELRRVIEVGNMRVALSRITEDQLADLEKLVHAINPQNNTHDQAEKADRMFHETIVAMGGNPLLMEIYKMMSKMLSIVFGSLMQYEEVVVDAYKAHLDIFEMMKKRDIEGCVQSMHNHLERVNNYARKYGIIP